MIKIMRAGMKMRRTKKGQKGKVNSLLLSFCQYPTGYATFVKLALLNDVEVYECLKGIETGGADDGLMTNKTPSSTL